MQLKHDALRLFLGQLFAVAPVGAFPHQLLQIVGLELDAVQLVVASEFLNLLLCIGLAHHHLVLLVLGKLVKQVLLRKPLAVLLLTAKLGGYVEHRHDGVAVYAVHLHLVCHLLGVLQCLGDVGKDGCHLLRGLHPLLLGIVHAVGVGIVLLRGYADKMVVRLAVLLLYKVHVVGGHQLDVVLPRQLYQHRVHPLLPLVGLPVGIGLVGLVTLQLDIVVVAEHPLKPQHRLLGAFQVAPHNQLGDFSA